MTFKRNFLALSVATLSASLTACGSSDAEDVLNDNGLSTQTTIPAVPETDTPKVDNPVNQTAKQSISGVTADGYLVNAKVCLDINANARCDDDEPMAHSEQAGAYSIDDISADIDLAKVSVIVEVIAGQTIDEDKPGVVLEKSYRLTAPEGVTEFISPITTLVSATIEQDKELSIEQAREAVKEKLGLAETDIDVMKDYVAAKQDDETGEDYHRIHKVAQVLAGVMAQADEEIAENKTDLTAEDKEIQIAVQKMINAKLDEIVEIVDQNTNENFDANKAVQSFIEKDHLSIAEIEGQIKQDRIEATTEKVSFANVMRSGGVYSLEGEHQLDFDESTSRCTAISELAYQHIMADDEDNINFVQYENTPSGFVLSDQSSQRDHLVWLAGEWQVPDNLMQLVSENDDGSVVVESQSDGRMQIWSQQVDLSGKVISDFMHEQRQWRGLFSDSLVFPEGATGYQLKFEQLNEMYYLPQSDDCQVSNDGQYESGFCNLVYTQDSSGLSLAATGYQQLLSDSTTTTQQLIQITHGNYEQVMMSLTGELSNGEGEAHFYLELAKACDDGTCDEQPLELIGTSRWALTDQGIEYKLPAKVQSWIDHEEINPVFTLHQGQVRRAYRVNSGNTERGDWSLNNVALNTVINVFEPSELSTVVDTKLCNLIENNPPIDGTSGEADKHPEEKPDEDAVVRDDEINHDGSMHDEDKKPDEQPTDEQHESGNADGTHPQDETAEHEPKVRPEILHDFDSAAALENKSYFVRIKDTATRVFFSENQSFFTMEEIVFEGDKSIKEQQGNWSLSETGELLLSFSEQDFTLIHLKENIGGDVIPAWQQKHTGEIEEFVLLEIIDIHPEDLINAPSFSLSAENPRNCRIDLFTNITANSVTSNQGGGYADLTLCVKEGEATMADVTWQLLANEAFELTVYQGNDAPHKTTMYWLGAEQVLMINSLSDEQTTEHNDKPLFEVYTHQEIITSNSADF